ncbi:hypothetical protein [Clostridium brassicae]|uniref:Uncharacterized protein n=1 Tax=Clostridium brassicae TaxID=2999072 RepID=A0ABT4D8Z6_9CLOT|nr:hypothetical protein [Clostridium brassicae]MCY6957711.1 hypothetical protein [Clostridium brassicae]
MAHVPDLDFIKNEEERAEAQRLALNIGQEMLIRRNEINSIGGLVKLIKEQI